MVGNIGIRGAAARALTTACAAMAALAMLAGCSSPLTGGNSQSSTGTTGVVTSSDEKSQTFAPSSRKPEATLHIASGSENREVAAAIQKAAEVSGVAVTLDYMGSLDIMNTLKSGADGYDAVWPASSMWISMGDSKHIVKNAASTSTTPVVFGIAKSKAVELGWADQSGKTKKVATSDIIGAVESGKLKFSMTSATQSNSGASAYLAFLTALTGKNEPISASDLANTDITGKVTSLLKGVDRSSGSSDWLKDMVVANPDRFDSMVNYESLVIQADKQLVQTGHDPLLAVYPSDGIAVSDSPLGYVDRGQGLDGAFSKFQQALSSKESKLLFEQAGRRTGLGGALANGGDGQVKDSFRAEWGIDTGADALKTIALPAADVVTQALNAYQTQLRKPSYTIWVVDYSGSMTGAGKDGVVKGLTSALDPTESAKYQIEPSGKDVNVFIPFSSAADTPVKADGADTAQLLSEVTNRAPNGGTNIYGGLVAALGNLPANTSDYTTAIVLMTDGQSLTDEKQKFIDAYKASGHDLPVFSIMFGDADPSQLDDIAKLTNAKVFDGREGDLAAVFREVKGFN